MYKNIIQIFFKLIRIGLGEPVEDFPILDFTQWQELYTLARQQAIVGVIYKSIERLPKENALQENFYLNGLPQRNELKNSTSTSIKLHRKLNHNSEIITFIVAYLKGKESLNYILIQN